MSNKNLFERNVFGLPRRQVKHANDFQARLIMMDGNAIDSSIYGMVKELYNMSIYEQLPVFMKDPRFKRKLDWALDPVQRSEMFSLEMEETAKLITMEANTGMVVGYLAMNVQNHVLALYIMPAFRKDRIGLSLLELYINRFDVKEVTAAVGYQSPDALAFFDRLGFVQDDSEQTAYPTNTAITNLIWRLAKDIN
jgi:N-acetylglutamate synthase-like GNAT family acetyltransferase